MELAAVASRFDSTPMWDAYTGQKLKGCCQVSIWDNPRRDGLTTVRRTISMADKVALPARMTLIIGGQVWLVGQVVNPDTWGADVTRKGYVTQMAMLGRVGSTKAVLENSTVPVYVSRLWTRDVKDISSTSSGQGQYGIYFTKGESVREGEFIYA